MAFRVAPVGRFSGRRDEPVRRSGARGGGRPAPARGRRRRGVRCGVRRRRGRPRAGGLRHRLRRRLPYGADLAEPCGPARRRRDPARRPARPAQPAPAAPGGGRREVLAAVLPEERHGGLLRPDLLDRAGRQRSDRDGASRRGADAYPEGVPGAVGPGRARGGLRPRARRAGLAAGAARPAPEPARPRAAASAPSTADTSGGDGRAAHAGAARTARGRPGRRAARGPGERLPPGR